MRRFGNIVTGALMASGLALAAAAPAMAHGSYGGGTGSAYSAPVVQSYSTGRHAEFNRDRSFEYGRHLERHRDTHDRMSMRDGRGSGFRGERGDYRR